jgi:hypothetical protein
MMATIMGQAADTAAAMAVVVEVATEEVVVDTVVVAAMVAVTTTEVVVDEDVAAVATRTEATTPVETTGVEIRPGESNRAIPIHEVLKTHLGSVHVEATLHHRTPVLAPTLHLSHTQATLPATVV